MLLRITIILCLGILVPECISAQLPFAINSGDSVSSVSRARSLLKGKINMIDSIPKGMVGKNINEAAHISETLKGYLKKSVGGGIASIKNAFSLNSVIPRQTVVLDNASAIYTGIVDTSFWSAGRYYYRQDMMLGSSWSIMDIPFYVGMQHQYMLDDVSATMTNIDFRFDKDLHLKRMQSRLRNKMDMSDVLNTVGNPAELLKVQARQLLSADLKELNSLYKGALDDDLAGLLGDPNKLFNINIQDLRQQLLDEGFVNKITQEDELLRSLRDKRSLGGKVDDEELKKLEGSVSQLQARQALLQRVAEHKQRWESSGLIKKIREADLLRMDRISNALKDPVFIRSEARKLLQLKSLERFFLNVNRLNIGRDALSLSPMSFRHFLHNGISTEFIGNKGKTFLLMAGKQKDFAGVADNGFSQSLFSNNSQMKAFRFGFKQGKISSSQISVSSFNQSMGNLTGSPFIAEGFRRVLVTTISNQLNIGKNGLLAVDLSRSATSYQESMNGPDSIFKTRNPMNRILSGDNFMDNTAFSLRYADELSGKGLSYQFNFSKVANGYTNPGNTFLNGGSLEFGGGFRKTLLNQRLQVSFRGNRKEYSYSDALDNKWRSLYAVVDVKWKMRKGQHVGIRYQPNRMFRIEDGVKYTASLVDRLSLESSLYKKLGKFAYRNYITLSYQNSKYGYSVSDPVAASSVQLTSFQNITIGRRLLYASINYTGANNRSQYVFFNSSFNGDLGCSYNLLKRITASSGIVYASVSGWYKQAGLRQTLSGSLGEQFSVNVYLDYRKNLEVIQSMWNQPLRADVSIKYMFR